MRRRKQIRLREYDYSTSAGYFVTICTKDHCHLFGEIADAQMRRSKIGYIVQKCWDELPSHYPGIMLDEDILMPNHVHGIIIIVDPLVGARHASPLRRKSIVLGNIIGSFKSAVTKNINEIQKSPGTSPW